MRFEWDERKRLFNIEKHGLDFLDAGVVFENPHVTAPSSHTGEKRFLAIGLFMERFVAVVYTMRGEVIRIISFRRARHGEREEYQKLYSNGA